MLTQKSQTYKFQCVSLSKHIEAEARSDLRRVLRVGFTVFIRDNVSHVWKRKG